MNFTRETQPPFLLDSTTPRYPLSVDSQHPETPPPPPTHPGRVLYTVDDHYFMSTTTYSYQISFDRQLTTFSHIIASIFQVAEFIKANYHNVSVTQTHHVGQIGLLERENAAILNESIKPLAKVTIEAFRKALDRLDLTCPFYLTQNDGTLIRYEFTGRSLLLSVYIFLVSIVVKTTNYF